ncbi:protein phosphatase 2C domain-containing protein [Longispora fulva]|uniref:protein phosphatase 2C domain-containing protein n=1 Tax=Longispora fulva TaxID=619741 RepID=UPI0018CAD8CC
MPSTRTHIAVRSGSTSRCQDHVFETSSGLVLLDGASSFDPSVPDGGWYAGQLGKRIADQLDSGDLADIVANAIASLAMEAELQPQRAPSSTVTLARWTAGTLDVLILGDSAAVVYLKDGSVEVLSDNRLAAVATEQREAINRHFLAGNGYDDRHVQLMAELQRAERQARNTPDGYWIAEAVPEAAYQAVRRSWRSDQVSAVLLASDGATDGIDRHGQPGSWEAARELIQTSGARSLIDAVHAAEESDPDGSRWHRSKRHDDKAIAYATFSGL